MKTRKSRKGQAAMEYLMSYGWVLIAVLVIIGILFSSGIFDVGRIYTQECRITPDLPCYAVGQQIGGDTVIRVNITNGLGATIQVQEITLKDIKTNKEISLSPSSDGRIDIGAGELTTPGSSILLKSIFSNENAEGEVRTYFINIKYQRVDGGLGTGREVSGRVKVRIESE